MKNKVPGHALSWWKYGYLWLVIAGPVVVVIASFVTLFIALMTPDPLVVDDYYRQGIEINKTLDRGGVRLVPAVDARNHAATGTVPTAKTARQP